jgi:hypothetical protein
LRRTRILATPRERRHAARAPYIARASYAARVPDAARAPPTPSEPTFDPIARLAAHGLIFALRRRPLWSTMTARRPARKRGRAKETAMTDNVQITDIAGPLRRPRNMAAGLGAGSIHDDATASKLGFKGGTVAGSIHMDQFAPVLVSLFGDEVFERGNLSLYFKQATVDNEPVRAFARRVGGAAQARVWMETETGALVAEGTASGGPDENTELTRRLAEQKAGGDLRMLAGCKVGDVSEGAPVRLDRDGLERRQGTITEMLAAYEGKGRWDGRVLPFSACVQAARAAQDGILKRLSGIVGLFGALEIQFLNGPLFADRDYVARARTLSLSESPKTENIWWEGVVSDPRTGKDILRHVQYLRFMKASSPLWDESKAR